LELCELIGQIALTQRRKVVVFSQWRRMLRLAHWATRDQLAGEGVRAAFFTGQEGQKRRAQNIVDFNDDPACRALFATDAGRVGLNLQRAATACINIELPWNPAVLEQRIGGIHRLGQCHPIERLQPGERARDRVANCGHCRV
jgi:SNF2 family DNA or RNA helicase